MDAKLEAAVALITNHPVCRSKDRAGYLSLYGSNDELEQAVNDIVHALPALLDELEAARLQLDTWKGGGCVHDAGDGSLLMRRDELDTLKADLAAARAVLESVTCADSILEPGHTWLEVKTLPWLAWQGRAK